MCFVCLFVLCVSCVFACFESHTRSVLSPTSLLGLCQSGCVALTVAWVAGGWGQPAAGVAGGWGQPGAGGSREPGEPGGPVSITLALSKRIRTL